MIDSYTLSLAQEYVELVDTMKNGRYSADEMRALESERQTTHAELCRVTGLHPREDMYLHAKSLLFQARMENWQ